MNNKHQWFAWLSIVGGLLHLLFVSFLHRENFIELWFFTTAGSAQAFLGAYALLHQDKWRKLVPALVVIHGSLIVMWAATRIFPAPFLTFPEAVGSADIIVVIVEVLAVIVGLQILARLRKSLITTTLVIALLVGSVNYVMAKGSEKVFRSIPVSTEDHPHSFMQMFSAPHDNSDNHHDDEMNTMMNEGMENMMDTSMGMPTPGLERNADEMIVVPGGHDNSDGHHDR